MVFKDISNQKFHKLTPMWPVGRQSYPHGGHQITWLATCDCGKLVVLPRCSIGKQVSCGCAKLAALRAPGRRRGTHQMSRTKTYINWMEMKRRCFNEKTVEYPNYGGRGIKICDRWMDFAAFFTDMGPRPEGKSLDRINNNGNYEPGNCKWSTPWEQAQNRRPKSKHRRR